MTETATTTLVVNPIVRDYDKIGISKEMRNIYAILSELKQDIAEIRESLE